MSPESIAVLIAAGDAAFRQSMRDALAATGFQLDEASHVRTALTMMSRRRFDLVIVDINLPDRGGLEACRRVRASLPMLGIVMVRTEGTENDEWLASEAGADDCIVWPCRYREMVARMVAVLRRSRALSAQPGSLLRAGNIELDLKRRYARRHGEEVHLSPREFELLATLMANTGNAMTHTWLARSAWGNEAPRNREYLRTYIQSLRNKLEDDPAHPQYILTQPWVGYRFARH